MHDFVKTDIIYLLSPVWAKATDSNNGRDENSNGEGLGTSCGDREINIQELERRNSHRKDEA